MSARQLSRHYGGIRAVDKVDIDLIEGEIRALIGPNGAGKSTLVGMLCGRIEPTSGSVSFKGRDITGLSAHQRVQLGIAYTFQITSVFANLSCRENVELAVQRRLTLPGSRTRLTRKSMQQETLKAIEAVGLGDYVEQKATNLAYGHQRLLEIAMGLALAPELLMLDEPTQGLSDNEIANFIEVVKRVSQTATVLLIEHNMSVVMALAEQISVLDNGQMLAQGTPAEIQANQQVQQAYLGTDDSNRDTGT